MFLAVSQRRSRSALEIGLILGLACGIGWASTGQNLPYVNASALLAAGGALALVGLLVTGARAPMVPFAALLVMFPLGDYIRKAGTGDPRLILLRDLLLMVGLVCLTARALPWREVIDASRSWLRPLAVFGAWFVVAAVNSAAFENIRIPFVGARLYFEYLPLIGLGWYVARDVTRLRRSVVFASVVFCTTTLIGILHGIQGPGFIPGVNENTELFTHLELLRTTIGQSAEQVFQPTGLFVEPGRFADWAFVNFAFGLALLPHRDLRLWRFVVPLIGLLGLFAASNRTTVVAAIVLAAIAGLHQVRVDVTRAVRLGLVVALAIAALALSARTFFPGQFESRVQFIGHSLNFTSSDAEGSKRVPTYARELVSDIRKGGLVGLGAGTQGLGRQYLGVEERTDQLTEGGLATVMLETGVIGFLLWVIWTGAAWRFARRTANAIAGPFGQSLSILATALAMQLFVVMFIGISAVQDFVFNSWLFLVLGFVAAIGRYGPPGQSEDAAFDDEAYSSLGSSQRPIEPKVMSEQS